ncbi:phosphomannomutase [Thermonema lapsum]|uniref:Phosphomannomutase n=1 Tax=Thermonema lapsum TaxID=28195 RepID=A0A846MLY7_9BACT|nr:phosphoglucosamine mutase [Thermonema lapsum]NIK72546.1 phosphomannomutase [Thermonema lapsum]
MTLIASISGIRGTIGGKPIDNLTPPDIVRFVSAYGSLLRAGNKRPKVVIGRDARLSGAMLAHLVTGTLQALGIDVIDVGLATTPTVAMAVPRAGAQGGIILTASHNPIQWNALKLLNAEGEFIDAATGEAILQKANEGSFEYAGVHHLGSYLTNEHALDEHIEAIKALSLVDVDAIRARQFRVVVDAVHSVGGIAVPRLLEALGVQEVKVLYGEPNGHFPHNPEPLPEHLHELSSTLTKENYDLGIAVDPDVDRLALFCEDGSPFGEEYTLVAVADYVLQHEPGPAVSNLSSSQALRVVCERMQLPYYASAVGEVNVVAKMKEVGATIGGEGNGGIIYPKLHYGRDALVGIALFLSYLAKSGKKVSALRATYPNFFMVKNKIELSEDLNPDSVLNALKEKYARQQQDTTDGLKIYFDDAWVHLRRSNTEPIIRIYTEAPTQHIAENLVEKFMADIRELRQLNQEE